MNDDWGLLTEHVEVEGVALSVTLSVETYARVVASTASAHPLQHQALVANDDAVVHVVVEDLALETHKKISITTRITSSTFESKFLANARFGDLLGTKNTSGQKIWWKDVLVKVG